MLNFSVQSKLVIIVKVEREIFGPHATRIIYGKEKILSVFAGSKVVSMKESNAILTFLLQAFIHKNKSLLTVINRYDMLSCIVSFIYIVIYYFSRQ